MEDVNGIINIKELEERQTVEQNDYVIIETEEGTRKIKADKLSSGGQIKIPVDPEVEPTEVGAIWISTK